MVECFDDREEFAFAAAQIVLEESRRAIGQRGRFSLVLAGGSTPQPLYEVLASGEVPIAWNQTHIFLGDERILPADDLRRNAAMIQRTLLRQLCLPPEQLHMPAAGPDPVLVAAGYTADMEAYFAQAGAGFDLLLLGLGSDGHTASLFPGSPALAETQARVVAVTEAVGDPACPRITMSLPLLNSARRVTFLLGGKAKQAIAQAIQDAPETAGQRYPAGLVQGQGRRDWLCRT